MGRDRTETRRQCNALLESSVFCLPGEISPPWLVLCLEVDRCQSMLNANVLKNM